MKLATNSRTLGLDTVQVLTAPVLRQLRAAGYRWVARYLRPDGKVLDHPEPGGDYSGCHSLSREERDTILSEDFAIVTPQFGPSRGMQITPDVGRQRGEAMVRSARGLGFPEGVHLWADAEGKRMYDADGDGKPGTLSDALACMAYLRALCAPVMAADNAGLYYAAGLPLTGKQLYQLPFTSYWVGANAMPTPDGRGLSIVQSKLYDGSEHGEALVYGLACDLDMARVDSTGGYFYWVVA